MRGEGYGKDGCAAAMGSTYGHGKYGHGQVSRLHLFAQILLALDLLRSARLLQHHLRRHQLRGGKGRGTPLADGLLERDAIQALVPVRGRKGAYGVVKVF